MCGISGFLDLKSSSEYLPSILRKMLNSIAHRGPDDHGCWYEYSFGLALGHRRLAILDLSPSAHQPMISQCGRYVIVFNGEIYNHLELRQYLFQSPESSTHVWHSHSDTETLLACIQYWGIERTLESIVGMFAFAVWDNENKCLFLARDRVGEKPLYYAWVNGVFLFASELKALRCHPEFVDDIEIKAVNNYFHLNYIPAPLTIYKNVYKLIPGSYLIVPTQEIYRNVNPSPKKYWSLTKAALYGIENPYKGSFLQAANELDQLLHLAVSQQSIADVPLGAFLSGGIDSSSIVAILQAQNKNKIKTFSIGMPDPKMDESRHAAEVANHFGTEHFSFAINGQDALDLIPKICTIWDEPMADSSQIPTYLVCKQAKQKVAVALSGDGGDEFFLGYSQYLFYQKVYRYRHLSKLPWEKIIQLASIISFIPAVSKNIHRANTLSYLWGMPNAQILNNYWLDRSRGSSFPLSQDLGIQTLSFPELKHAAETVGLFDAGTYLPDDILVKVDRAAMSNSLETRAPLLDHRIIEFSFRLPIDYKIGKSQGKRILREVLYRYIPQKIVEKPKMGFSIPLENWLSADLKPWVLATLAQAEENSLFSKRSIQTLIYDYHQGKFNSNLLWSILVFQMFLNEK